MKNRITRILYFAGILFAGASLLLLAEKQLYLSVWAKSGSWIALLLVSAIATFWIVRIQTLDAFKSFYRSFCRKFDYQNVENALDLHLSAEDHSSTFHNLAISRNLGHLDENEWSNNLNKFTSGHLQHRVYLSGITLFLFSLILVLSATFSNPDAFQRSLTFWETYEKPNPFQFEVRPGDITVEHGSSVAPSIEFRGNRVPDQVSLAIKTDIEDEYRLRPMSQFEDGSFSTRDFEMTNNAGYHILMDGYRSDSYRIGVQLRPRFESLTAVVNPPSYTGLEKTEHSYPFAQIRAYGGSRIEIEGVVNKPVEILEMTTGTDTLDLAGLGDESFSYRASYSVEQSDTLQFRISDMDGLTNQNPFRFSINKLQDEYPTVIIREPAGRVQMAEPESLDIFYRADDDFGLTRARLNWELTRAFTERPVTGTIDLRRPEVGETDYFEWNLADLDLKPRDKIEFYITVWDNDEWNGYKSTNSGTILVEIPSMSAHFDELDQKERNVQDALDEISENYRQMQEEYDRFRNRLRENPEPGFEEEQMLEDVQERQDEIDESIRRMNEQFQELRREMESSSNISEETQRAYRELQELMDELDDPELRNALEELRRSLQDLSPQELQRAMENFEFNEQVYRERLERTAELFKTLKMNSDLDKLAQQYEDMAERMESTTRDEASPDEIHEQQQGVRDDSDHLERQLRDLDKNPPQRAGEQLRNLKEESLQELQELQQELDELIEQSGGEEAGEPGEMQQRRQQISEQMQQRSQRLREAQQQISGQQINVNILALQRALYTLIELSETQEELTIQSGRTDSRSQGYVELARIQNNIISQFSQVSDTLQIVSSEMPQVSNSVNRKKIETEQKLNRSREQMSERDQRGSVVASRESLGGINDLASMLASVIDQLMDQSDGAGGGQMSLQQMIEQMQNMSGDQQMLNQQLQEMINDMQGDRLTREQSERLEQIARQQNEIRKQLEELQRSGALSQGDRTLSEMQRMIEDMEDAINDLRGGMTDPMMVRRQQNILSRMLDAEESLQQRGEEDEREGERIKDYERTLPPDITIEELRQEIRTRLQDPNYTRFRDDYQRLIERYFELLRRFEDQPLP